MTETPQQQGSNPDNGFDRDALRDFERLRRSRTDRKIAGVAGGLGRHLNIDPTVLRVLFVVLVFFGGAGLLLYGAAWLIVPEEGSDEATISTTPGTRNAVLAVVAVLAALLLIGDSWGGFGFPWPLAIIALVVVLYIVNRDRSRQPQSGPPQSGVTPSEPGTSESVYTPSASPVGQASYGWVGSGATDTGSYPPPSGPPSWAPVETYAPAPKPSKKDRGPKLFGITLAFIALALGVLGLLDVAGVPVVDGAYAAVALGVIGLMLVVGSFAGRPGGLIFLGLVATFVLLVSTAGDEYGWDEPDRTYTPQSATEALTTDYEFFANSTTLDLTQVDDPAELDNGTIDISAFAGEVRVIVPEGLDVDVDAQIDGGGEIDVAGARDDGGSPTVSEFIDGGGSNDPTMNLDIELSFGSIDVVQQEAAA